ncbi:LexA repressor [Saezia sanguinis]|jgi:phage repressor protein C with HTH and peptisase S24 domain|uniref:LexA repressor n=1 Tax=Saezia sanguinis TaxID=1965230 RepID=A0A433SCR5_9BURK|nr:S24 family peptidase [Saezia sanguinis]RUS66535.1 LexA repressor [Saezia sanguinis]
MKESDITRRTEFQRYFEDVLRGNRQQLIQSGISKGRVTQYLDPKEPFGERAAIAIEDKLGVDRGTIFPSLLAARHYYSPLHIPHQHAPHLAAAIQHIVNQAIPVVGSAQLGDNGHFYELQYPVGQGDGYIQWATSDPNAYALRCKGDSMKPRIRHGEFVIVEPNHDYHPGDEVVVRDKRDRVMVKQLNYIRDGMVYLQSVNEAFGQIGIPQEDIEIMHYVAGIAKSALHMPDSK